MKNAVAIWIAIAAYLNCAGWVLSAIHHLDAAGYWAVVVVGAIALGLWQKKYLNKDRTAARKKLIRRFRQPFPAAFLAVSILIFIGGALYPPNNYDAMTYRLPRMMNWLAAGHWFWIPAINERMNWTGPGWEWIGMPCFALLHSDRGLFLINLIGFLFMPGLLFSIFRRLGMARNVAWTWMWILPLAFGYATQAGSIGNDFTGTFFFLASLFFGLSAKCSGKSADVWLAGLAAALMTAVKLSNLPLLLPCLVAVWPALPLLRQRWLPTIAMAVVAAQTSILPALVLNQSHSGSWTGDPDNQYKVEVNNPAAGVVGNSLLLLQQSLMPPVLPGAHKAAAWFDEKLPPKFHGWLHQNFPRYSSTLNELPQEETSGLGLDISFLALAGIAPSLCGRQRKKPGYGRSRHGLAVIAAAGISTLFCVLKMGSEADARLMLPYYPPIIAALLLLPGHAGLLRHRLWRGFALIVALGVLPSIILSPSRPLFPAMTISARLAREHPDSRTLTRMAAIYSTYSRRNDLLAGLRDSIPTDVPVVGFYASENHSDYSLWRPFGRHVEYLHDEGHSVAIPAEVEWIVMNETAWRETHDQPLEEWAGKNHLDIVKTASIISVVNVGEEQWYLLRRTKS